MVALLVPLLLLLAGDASELLAGTFAELPGVESSGGNSLELDILESLLSNVGVVSLSLALLELDTISSPAL